MFASPLGLIALLAVPAVLALHLFRRRFEPREVSALFLWPGDDRAPVAGRRREPLRSNASLWCEMLCAALLAIAFAGPRASCAGARAEHLVVVLDDSASMAAGDASGSARDRAIELVRERLAGLAHASRATLVLSGRPPTVLAGPGAFVAQASAALDAWAPSTPRHDLSAAVAMGMQFAGDARVVLVTDHYRPEEWPDAVEVAALGRPLDNWAITHAARTRGVDGAGAEVDRVFLTVSSFARVERTLAVQARVGDAALARDALTLAPGARTHLAFSLPRDTAAVEIALGGDGLGGDALAIDDVAFLAPPPSRTLGLFTDLDDGTLRSLGLAGEGESSFDRWLALVPSSVAAPDAASAHLVLSRSAPASGPAWTLELAALGSERRDLVGPFLVDRTHALLEGVTLQGVVWSVDPARALGGAPLISVGDTVVASERDDGGRRVFELDLDPLRSSLQRSPDWPILLSNLAEARRAALPGAQRTNLALGETLVYRPGAELGGADERARTYVLEGVLGPAAGEQRELLARRVLEIDDVERAGVHRLRLDQRVVAEFALSFLDAAESDLRAAGSGVRESSLAAAELDAEMSWLAWAVLAGALVALCADWWVLTRGVGGRKGAA